ncbi:MAG: caspase family protein [Mariniphaga sp.]
MKVLFITLLLIVALFSLEAQTKRALVVGIGNYPVESGWTKIHGDNDVPLIANALGQKGFISNNIRCLANENATKKNIIKSLNQMIKEAKLNDFLYIHFSTHGQQVVDVDGDEEDGLDEAVIPYDARKTFEKGVYEGKNHLLDDELNHYLTSLRSKIGKTGSLLVVIDACHSGDATRGEDSTPNDSIVVRGTSEIFQAVAKKSYSPHIHKPLEWVVISASQSYQNNFEYRLNDQYFGSLSYAVKLALSDLSGKEDFVDFFNQMKIKREVMNVARYPQRPMIEGDNLYKNQKIF